MKLNVSSPYAKTYKLGTSGGGVLVSIFILSCRQQNKRCHQSSVIFLSSMELCVQNFLV